jgi:hypothetical protein
MLEKVLEAKKKLQNAQKKWEAARRDQLNHEHALWNNFNKYNYVRPSLANPTIMLRNENRIRREMKNMFNHNEKLKNNAHQAFRNFDKARENLNRVLNGKSFENVVRQNYLRHAAKYETGTRKRPRLY